MLIKITVDLIKIEWKVRDLLSLENFSFFFFFFFFLWGGGGGSGGGGARGAAILNIKALIK